MLTDKQIEDGWKPHDGGPCPVALISKPGVMFADGVIVEPGCVYADGWTDHYDSWRHEGHKRHHIIAYKEQNNGH